MERDKSASSDSSARPIQCDVEVSSDRPDWRGYLCRHSDATVYHDPRWGEVMRSAYRNQPFYLTAVREGATVGVLQLIKVKSVFFGCYLCSVPYFDAAGILADDDDARQRLQSAARGLMVDHGADWVELRQIKPLDEATATRTDKVTMRLRLPPDSEGMWKQLRTKVRTKVRKARKHNLEVERAGSELLREFYTVYSRTMRDLGSPAHSIRFFRTITEAFAECVKVFVVRRDGRPLAASLALADRQSFHVPWSGSDRRFRELGANRLLYWEMLSFAADSGATLFDFGRSTKDSGTYQFKREWDAEPVQLNWHYLVPAERAIPELRADSPKYRLMIACWKKLPLWAARRLGPHIISRLS